jgi:hypothetical protein
MHIIMVFFWMLLQQVVQSSTSLHFVFYADGQSASAAPAGGMQSINLPNLDSCKESCHEILAQLVERYQVPEHMR